VQKIVKYWMDDCLDSVKADCALSDVLGGMKLVSELRSLHVTKKAADSECDAVHGEVTTRSLLWQ
jgi:hypothetical protein